MPHIHFSRGRFISRSIGVASASVLLGFHPSNFVAAASAGRRHSIRLGGPSFAKTDDPEELARDHRKLGYSAAYCPNIPLNDSSRIRATVDAFAKHDVVIAEVGRWVNLLDANPEKRRK